MPNWWDAQPEERYWCEITDRADLGADLKCPQSDEKGQPYWSYSLIHEVWPGDIVFHYSTNVKAVVAASVAGAPVETRQIVWAPHGTVGRTQREERLPRAGWWRPLYGFTRAATPLTLDTLNDSGEASWVREWIRLKEADGFAPRAPFQRYPGRLRGAQGYLTKMPAEFVLRWQQLTALASALEPDQEKLDLLSSVYPSQPVAEAGDVTGGFNPKSDADYLVTIQGGVQHRTRRHERLVKQTGELLRALGAIVETPHPIDLRMIAPVRVFFEAKVVGARSPLFAVREAVGQILEYRHFLKLANHLPCLLLDAPPGFALTEYIEEVLHLLIVWCDGTRLLAGPKTSATLSNSGLLLGTIASP